MKLLFTLLLASATLTASAQTKKAPIKTSTAPIELKSEKDYYKEMYELADKEARNAHADMQWAMNLELSVLLGVVAIIVGAQVFSNYYVNIKKLGEIESRINNRIVSELTAVRDASAELQKGVLEQLSKANSDNLQLLRTRTNEIEDKLRALLDKEISYFRNNNSYGNIPFTNISRPEEAPLTQEDRQELMSVGSSVTTITSKLLAEISLASTNTSKPLDIEGSLRPGLKELAELLKDKRELHNGAYKAVYQIIGSVSHVASVWTELKEVENAMKGMGRVLLASPDATTKIYMSKPEKI